MLMLILTEMPTAQDEDLLLRVLTEEVLHQVVGGGEQLRGWRGGRTL